MNLRNSYVFKRDMKCTKSNSYKMSVNSVLDIRWDDRRKRNYMVLLLCCKRESWAAAFNATFIQPRKNLAISAGYMKSAFWCHLEDCLHSRSRLSAGLLEFRLPNITAYPTSVTEPLKELPSCFFHSSTNSMYVQYFTHTVYPKFIWCIQLPIFFHANKYSILSLLPNNTHIQLSGLSWLWLAKLQTPGQQLARLRFYTLIKYIFY